VSALLALSRDLVAAVVELRSKNALLGIRSASSRLLAHLSLLADDDGYLALRGPWTAVALEIGLSHEAVYRALADLEGAGQLRRDGKDVWLKTASSS
jgi:DNA-binding IclR family transcriptional regulator